MRRIGFKYSFKICYSRGWDYGPFFPLFDFNALLVPPGPHDCTMLQIPLKYSFISLLYIVSIAHLVQHVIGGDPSFFTPFRKLRKVGLIFVVSKVLFCQKNLCQEICRFVSIFSSRSWTERSEMEEIASEAPKAEFSEKSGMLSKWQTSSFNSALSRP